MTCTCYLMVRRAGEYMTGIQFPPVLCPGQRPSWYSYARNLPSPTKKTVDLYSIPTSYSIPDNNPATGIY